MLLAGSIDGLRVVRADDTPTIPVHKTFDAADCLAAGGSPNYRANGSFASCSFSSGGGPGPTSGGGGNPGGGITGGGGTPRVPNTGVSVTGRDARQNGTNCANPIIPATGNKIEPENDFTSSGEMPLSLTRTYNHYWAGAGLFGKNWVSNFDYMLTFGTTDLNACFPRPGGGSCAIGAATTIYAWRPDGRTIKFIKRADGIFYEDKAEAIATITRQADGTFVLSSEDNATESYSPAGRILELHNLHTVGWTFTYANGTYLDRVTHVSGRYVAFTWSNGQLLGVRDPAGTNYAFTYSANLFGVGLHRLASAALPATPATIITYHYEQVDDSSALTGKSFNGTRYSRFKYDANGYATSSEHVGAGKTTFAYTPGENGALTVLMTNPLGKTTTLTYKDGNQLTATGHPSATCPSTMYAETVYDANGYPKMTSDYNGNNTSYTYNAKGQLLTKTEGFGTAAARTTEYVWGANQVVSVKVVGISETLYDTTGGRLNSLYVTNLSANGVANEAHSTRYSYTYHAPCNGTMCAYGMLASMTVDGPLQGLGNSDIMQQRFDPLGNLTSVMDGGGNVVTYSNHTGLGMPGRVQDANGNTIDRVYDARGRVIQVKTYRNGATQTYIYAYDGFGRLAAVTAPDGQKHVYQYDVAGRLTLESEADASGTFAQVAYTYNAMSLPTSIKTQRSAVQAAQGTQL